MLNLIIILLSLLASTIASVLILKKRNNKWLGMLSAFCINTIMLLVATSVLYNLDEEARLFGFGHSGLYVLIFFIPVITWINFLILEFARVK